MDGTVEAVVRVGTVETTYVRAGRGLPVLLLMEGTAATVAASLLFQRLARGFRVVAPILVPGPSGGPDPGSPTPVHDRLRDLLEGLGVERAHLVAEAGMALLMEALPVGEEWLGGLIVVDGDAPAESLDEALAALPRTDEAPPGGARGNDDRGSRPRRS